MPLYFCFLADQISCRSYVGSVYRMRSRAVSGFSFMNFQTVGLFRSDTLRFSSMVLAMRLKCLGWPCPATYIFCFSRHPLWYFVSLRTEIRDIATHISGRKWVQSMDWTCYSERVILQFMCVGSRCGVNISSLHSAGESQERRNSCSLLRSYFIGSCHVGVSKRLLRSIILASSPCLSSQNVAI